MVSCELLLLGCRRTGGIFLKSIRLMPKMLARLCMGDRCLLMCLLALAFDEQHVLTSGEVTGLS